MSVQVVEITGSRDMRNAGGLQGARRFFAYDDALATPLIEDIMAGDGMPSPGDPHPDTPSLVANNYTMAPSSEKPGAWSVTWAYLPPEFPLPTGPEPVPDEPDLPFVGLNTSLSLTIVDMWKSDPEFPSNPSAPGATTDIGGTEVHVEGYPISMALSTVDISISNTVTAQTIFAGSMLNAMGKRNASTFMGLPEGTVLYRGSNVTRVGHSSWDVSYDFAYDPWFHMRQVPARDKDGNPAVVDGETPTLDVYWRQPFPSTVEIDWAGEFA